MSRYTTTLAALTGLFAEPSGGMNGEIAEQILESASLKVIDAFQSGAPGNSAVVLSFVAPVAMTFKAGLAESAAVAGTAATAEAIFNLSTDGGATWGTLTFAAAGTVGAFAAAADEEVAAGSLVELTAPASADATLADIAISLGGKA